MLSLPLFPIDFCADLMPKDAAGHMVMMLGEGQAFMSLIIGCSLTGTGLAIVFLNNGSTGGTDIIAACVNKYHDISLGQVLMGVDILIVGSCLFFPQFGDVMDACIRWSLVTVRCSSSVLC